MKRYRKPLDRHCIFVGARIGQRPANFSRRHKLFRITAGYGDPQTFFVRTNIPVPCTALGACPAGLVRLNNHTMTNRNFWNIHTYSCHMPDNFVPGDQWVGGWLSMAQEQGNIRPANAGADWFDQYLVISEVGGRCLVDLNLFWCRKEG